MTTMVCGAAEVDVIVPSIYPDDIDITCTVSGQRSEKVADRSTWADGSSHISESKTCPLARPDVCSCNLYMVSPEAR